MEFPIKNIPKYQIVTDILNLIKKENFPLPWTYETPIFQKEKIKSYNNYESYFNLKMSKYKVKLKNYEPKQFFIKN